MKKLKNIEASRFDLNPDAKLSPESMMQLQGGSGCICFRNKFYIDGTHPTTRLCICDNNPFGLCSNVNNHNESTVHNEPRL